MATNDFLTIAGGGGAFVETQAIFAADAAVLANGFPAGILTKEKLNKAIRQHSIMSAVLAQFIADRSGANSVDDGTTATLLANLKLAGAPRIATIRDEKSSGTSGGTFTAGAWRTRTLNTLTDPTSIVSLASNQITLQAGTYLINANCPASSSELHQARLQNITDATTTLAGSSEDNNQYASPNDENVTTRSIINGIFTIAAAKTFEIQHQCSVTATSVAAGAGFGLPVSFGISEVYTSVILQKL